MDMIPTIAYFIRGSRVLHIDLYLSSAMSLSITWPLPPLHYTRILRPACFSQRSHNAMLYAVNSHIISSPGAIYTIHIFSFPSIPHLPPPTPSPHHQNNHTQTKTIQTAAKNPTHTFHPTPVFSAILNIRFIVPLSLTLVLSKESFILSASEEEERISEPMATVI